MKRCKELSGSLVSKWYKKSGRKDLPWRDNISPYRVWISEIILQQTQVKTGIDYFENFVSSYPNLKSIKDASEDDIYKLWRGLGYYRRASYIYQAKEIIHKKFAGKFPESYDSIISLPGIGRSTAGAILSIAFKKPYPILDGNVKRVISRFFYKKDFNENLFWKLSSSLIDTKDPFSYQQGIMDIGATVCHKKIPNCENCPLKLNCKSKINNNFFILPSKKVKKKNVYLHFLIHQDDNKVFLIKDTKLGFWKNLWIPPYEIREQNEYDVRHNLSHRNLFITFNNAETPTKAEGGKWFAKEKLKNLATPKPISDKLLKI